MKITISLAPGVPFIRASDPAFARLDAAALQAQLQAALASGGDPEATIRGAIEAERRRLRGEEEVCP
jgi:hypothetical protein